MNRNKLIILTSAFAFFGLTCVLLLFLKSGMPASDRAPPTHIISLADITPGTYIEVEWHNRPVVVFRPNEQTEKELEALNSVVHGPTFPVADGRVFVYERISTHLGCAAVYRTEKQGGNIEGVLWFGGWIDPCHFGAWDKAGRSYIRRPVTDKAAQLPNLVVPKWRYAAEDMIELL